jgi:hypothetical protein
VSSVGVFLAERWVTDRIQGDETEAYSRPGNVISGLGVSQ